MAALNLAVTAEDVARWRADTPAVDQLVHFNNAGAALPPVQVLDTVVAYLRREATIGGYEAADEAEEMLTGLYTSAARLLNAAPKEIAFVENATRAWDMAFYGMRFEPGDRILTAQAEYVSNYLAYLQVVQRTGAVVEVIPNDATGQASVETLAAMIDERVKLISITHVPSGGGLINPAAAIGRVARAANIPYLLDACQSVGQMPIDVEAIGCDMLSVTGRKYLRGPRGTGLLYVRTDFLDRLDPPFAELRSAAWTAPDSFRWKEGSIRFESWESFVAGRAGLARAIDYALDIGLERIAARVQALAARLRHLLSEVPGVTIHDVGRELCGIVTFGRAGVDPAALQSALRAQRINVSVSPREYALIDMDRRGIVSMIRASAHYYNDEEEIDRLVAAVASIR